MFTNVELYLDDPQGSNANCGDKTVTTDPYRLLIMVGGVGGDFSQTNFGHRTILLVFTSTCASLVCVLPYNIQSNMDFGHHT